MGKPKLSHVIVSDYLHKLADNELAEGELLPTEATLAATYQVSRTAVREAIQALAAKGFLRVRQGSGSTVAPRTEWNVLDAEYLQITAMGSRLMADLLEARNILEPGLAALAAERAGEHQVDRLRELHQHFLDQSGRTPAEHADRDIAFHAFLAECTGNPVLISLHSSTVELGRQQRSLMAEVPGAIERAMFWHGQILDAVVAGDAAAAQDAMRMHMRQVHAESLTVNETDVEAHRPE